MANDDLAESSTELLGQIVRLLGILVVRSMPDGSSQTDKILLFHAAGLSNTTIADLTGAAAQTVRNRISEAKGASHKTSAKRKNARES